MRRLALIIGVVFAAIAVLAVTAGLVIGSALVAIHAGV